MFAIFRASKIHLSGRAVYMKNILQQPLYGGQYICLSELTSILEFKMIALLSTARPLTLYIVMRTTAEKSLKGPNRFFAVSKGKHICPDC